MPGPTAAHPIDYAALDDAGLVARAALRDARAVREITTRYNQRLFRTAWSVLRDQADAEEVVQEAYLKAFRGLDGFAGQSSLSTWLVRIVLNAAVDRGRRKERRRTDLLEQDVAVLDAYRRRHSPADATPEDALMRKQLADSLKSAIAQLTDDYSSVVVLRDIEGMSVRETAEVLGVSEDVVKTRLSRARRQLRRILLPEIGGLFQETLPFAGADCERMTARVLAALEV